MTTGGFAKYRRFNHNNPDRTGWGGFDKGDRVSVVDGNGTHHPGFMVTYLDPDRTHVMVKRQKMTPWRVHHQFLRMEITE